MVQFLQSIFKLALCWLMLYDLQLSPVTANTTSSPGVLPEDLPNNLSTLSTSLSNLLHQLAIGETQHEQAMTQHLTVLIRNFAALKDEMDLNMLISLKAVFTQALAIGRLEDVADMLRENVQDADDAVGRFLDESEGLLGLMAEQTTRFERFLAEMEGKIAVLSEEIERWEESGAFREDYVVMEERGWRVEDSREYVESTT